MLGVSRNSRRTVAHSELVVVGVVVVVSRLLNLRASLMSSLYPPKCKKYYVITFHIILCKISINEIK